MELRDNIKLKDILKKEDTESMNALHWHFLN
jgi:hypothetical protein